MRLLHRSIAGAMAVLMSSGLVPAAAAFPDSSAPGDVEVTILGSSTSQLPLSSGDREFYEFVLSHSVKADPAGVDRSVRFGNQVATVTDGLRDKFPESFVEGGLSEDPTSSAVAWFSFAGEAPAAAVAIIDALPFKVELRQGLPFSVERIKEVQGVAYETVRSSRLVTEASSTSESLTGIITIDVQSEATNIRGQLDELVKKALAERFHHEVLPEVIITVGSESVGEDTVLTGGTDLGPCTAGFTVVVSNNRARRGLVTAGHCPDDLRYEGRSVLRYEGELLVPKSDLQWHELTNSEGIRNYIVYETQLRTRKVVGYGNPVYGQYICRWGNTTNANCDYVNNTSGNTCSVSGRCGLFEMTVSTSDLGDSGGPWWSGSGADAIARGVHSGYRSPGVGRRFDIFTPIALLQNQLGVTVYLG